MTAYNDIRAERSASGVLRITLNRPDARNALRTAMLGEIADALNEAAADDDIRCAMMTGGPEVFAAGADVKEIAEKSLVDILNDPRVPHWNAIRSFPKPLIAAVNGYCLGAGNELAMCADILIAGEGAQFGQPEINLGLIPGAGGTQNLTRAVGKSLAMKMVLCGEFITASEALAAGLVAEVTPADKTIERALELAEKIARKPPVSVRLAKEAVLKAFETTLAQGLAFERKSFAATFGTDDRAEGVKAFIEKRRPEFRGR